MPQIEIIVTGDGTDDQTMRGIRALLKRLGRDYLLRCVTVRPVDTGKKNADGALLPTAQKSETPTAKREVVT